MVPATFIFLASLPLTNNGKVDRRALPAPDGVRPDLKAEFVAPRTDAEKILAQIWSEVLELANVGVDDNFFELGGDSIRSIAILSKAQQRGLHFSLQQIFRNPTIAALARLASPSLTLEERAGERRANSFLQKTTPFSLISPED